MGGWARIVGVTLDLPAVPDPPASAAKPVAEAVLDALEAEAIWALRETAAAFRNPVMLYSIGKDSGVMLHLAAKAFAPGPIPFPVLHVDTTWKFRDMITFRGQMVEQYGLDLRVATNTDAVAEGVTPFSHGAQEYTRLMKTVALRAALDEGGYDAAIGGSRRDEERSRAKERIFSLRMPGHRWEPRRQRPELWHTVNAQLSPGQTMRTFPLSNWTEIDVWHYVRREGLPVVPLYFAADAAHRGPRRSADRRRRRTDAARTRRGAGRAARPVPVAGLLPAERGGGVAGGHPRRGDRRDGGLAAVRACRADDRR